ncbi:transglutaminase family protein [Marinivivus vitaminiproducens]|uniref:transglutaminase family protein n=1 Tax=Marinivivus vitaminiproducens TaxID=3035935 RepID=UPI0027981645|nr:transglutaminase family protein [Geminicoccaceae bacterium SCSIO 64248]
MTVLEVRHTTTYRYSEPVRFGEHRLMFRPRDSYDQRLLASSLDVTPKPSAVRWIHDVFGNCVALVRFDVAADVLRFETTIRLDHTPQSVPDFQIDEGAKVYPFAYDDDEAMDLERSVERHCPDPDDVVGRWARRFLKPGGRTETSHLLMTMAYAIKEGFAYSRRTAPGTQDPILTLTIGKGTCRDFALLMMEAVRSLGFAARFVTGYIYVPDRDGSRHLGGGSTHAWCQVYLPGAGWVEFDPTNGIIGSRDLIRVAVARDPRQAVPLSGTFFGVPAASARMTVQVNVTTLRDSAPGPGASVRETLVAPE